MSNPTAKPLMVSADGQAVANAAVVTVIVATTPSTTAAASLNKGLGFSNLLLC